MNDDEKYFRVVPYIVTDWQWDGHAWSFNNGYRAEEWILAESVLNNDDKLKRWIKLVYSLKPNIRLSSIVLDGDDTFISIDYSTTKDFRNLGSLSVEPVGKER